MSSEALDEFLKALEVVKEDYKCVVCSKYFRNAVTLSKCFHMICADDFVGLKRCPTCNISLKDTKTYEDERIDQSIESIKKLDEIFKNCKSEVNIQSTKIKSKKRGKPDDLEIEDSEDIEVFSKKLGKSKQKTETIINKKAENKIVKKAASEASRRKIDENVSVPGTYQSGKIANTSLLSTVSSKINKTIEKRNNKGETMLHIACRLGKIDQVTELLEQGANTNTKDHAGWTPLHEAVQNGRLDLVQLLLKHNTLIDVPGQGNETPLHEAVRYGHTDIAIELVKNGANIDAKNCKGDTPLQLASETMKNHLFDAAENVQQTQSVNITYIAEVHSELDSEDIHLFCVSQSRTIHTKLKTLIKSHTNLHVEAKFSNKVTHLIVDADNNVCKSSLDVLQGIVHCIWILNTDWVNNSTDKKLEPFKDYEVNGVGASTYNGPKNARYNKYKQLPGIFNGCHFYLHNFIVKYEISKSVVLTKAFLSKLIVDAGGVVLRRVPNPESIPESERLVPYHAKKGGLLTKCSHYIIYKDIYEPTYNMEHLKALPIGWLIECIEKYELCEPW